MTKLIVAFRSFANALDLPDVGWRGMDWIDLAQDRDRWRAVVNAVMNPWGFIKCGEFLD